MGMSDELATPEISLPRPQTDILPGGGLRVRAAAKINLNLLVGPRRPDGFHSLDSAVAKVTLYDEIDIHPRTDGRFVLSCDAADCGPVEKNLALRAATLLAEGRKVGGADLTLRKKIPAGRGLGGGSSDAAAVLAGLNALWGLDLPGAELGGLAARLGSDVPLFLGPASVRMSGRGEVLSALPVCPFHAVLVLPEFACATAEVYRAFDSLPAPAGEPLPPEVFAEPPSRWRAKLVNHLALAAERVAPALAALRKELQATLRIPVCLTGSGSAMFVLCDDETEAGVAAGTLAAATPARIVVVRRNPW